MKSKVLAVYCIESYALKIDESLLELVNSTTKYVSYKYTTSAKRITSIHANEYKNIKARYESLIKVKVDDFVSINRILYKIKELLLLRKVNNTNLFLAAK